MRILKVLLVPQNCLNFGRRWCKISEMNTNDVKKVTGYTDRQLDYLLNQIDVLKREKAQGKAREYSHRDIVFLKLATSMRKSGVMLRDINKVFNLLVENSNKAAALAIYPTGKGKPIVQITFDATENDVINMFLKKPAQSFLLDGAWLTPEEDDKPILFIGSIPYDDKVQLELELKEKAVQNEQ